jgi:hypothetical protein
VSVLAAIAALWLTSAADATPAAADPEIAGAPAPAGGPDAPDQQAAIKAAFQAAEAMQGPLDGVWRLQDQRSGRTLFIFAMSDAGGAPAPLAATPDHPGVEGAWRDPARPGSPDASGFLDSVRGDGRWVQIRFVQGPDRRAEVLTLRASGDARWSGDLADAGASSAVVMTRF